MDARWFRNTRLIPLLALLFLNASAAGPHDAVHAARAAIDRADYDLATRLIGDALKQYGTRDSADVWELRVLRGEVLVSRGRSAEALQALAFDIPSRYARTETTVRQVLMRAYGHYLSRDMKTAAETIATAKSLAEKYHPDALGDVYVAMGTIDSKRREEYSREALVYARRAKRSITEAKAMINLANALADQERYAEAIQFAEQALHISRPMHVEKTTQNAEGVLGWAYFELGDFEEAEELFTAAEATSTRIGADFYRVAWLIQLGNIRFERRDWSGADRFYREAVGIGRSSKHYQLGIALANLARVAIELGRFEDARRFNAEALDVKRAEKNEEAELSSNIVEARIAIASSDLLRAEKLLRDVVRETNRSTTLVEAESWLARLYARMNRQDVAATHFQRAVDATRQARSEIKDRELRFSFFNTAQELFTAYVDFLASSNRKEDALAVTELSRAQTLEEGLNARAEPRALDARAVAKKNNATILCYWLGRDRSYLWVVTAAEVKLVPLPPDTAIEKTVTAYGNDLRSPYGWLAARGEELYRTLIAPAGIAKGSRVIVVADGKLHTLNFETLVVPGASRHYWIEDVTVMNAGSLQLLARSASKPKTSVRMLLVGNAPNPAFPQLRFAADEMRRIERRFPNPKVLEGPAATPAAYKAASPGTYDYVHFVAHGVPTRKRPLDSAVILARDASSSYKLLARDVVDQPLNARLVTISSCHGAGTRTYAGEGVVGLAWAFLRAGADQVVASLWEVNDAAAPQLMDAMYEGIRANRDPAVALRDAKLKLLRSGKLFRYPRYWAPFVLYAGT